MAPVRNFKVVPFGVFAMLSKLETMISQKGNLKGLVMLMIMVVMMMKMVFIIMMMMLMLLLMKRN